jgi:sigma-B regulation protein RsbU (phosphoserine phosphatase)
VLVDMTHCNYVSSAGISSFFDLRKKVQTRHGVLSFCNLQPQIKKVFEIVKALPLECIFSNTNEADAYLDRMMVEELKKTSPKK